MSRGGGESITPGLLSLAEALRPWNLPSKKDAQRTPASPPPPPPPPPLFACVLRSPAHAVRDETTHLRNERNLILNVVSGR